MGNKTNKYGNIVVTTDQPYYISGGVVTGNVYLNVIHPFQAYQLLLIIQGKEQSWWKVRNTSNEQNQDTYTNYTGENILYSNFMVMYDFPMGTVPRGQFTFPFILRLHNYLPGSFSEDVFNYRGEIRYKLRAEIQPQNKDIDLKYEQPLVIRQPMKEIQRSMYEQLTVQPKTWCCFSHGRCNIKCYFQKNSYLPGDTAVIICEIDNLQSDLDISGIRCTLTKKVTLTSDEGSQKMFDDVISEVRFPGIEAGRSRLGEEAQRMSIRLVNQSQKDAVQPSTNGNLVKCNYQLSVTAVLDGCICCTNMPSVQAHIKILSPPLVMEGIQPPTDWAPQVFQKQEMLISNRNSYRQGMGGNPYLQMMNTDATTTHNLTQH